MYFNTAGTGSKSQGVSIYTFEPLDGVSIRTRIGEGPVWSSAFAELWWVDLPSGTWHRHPWQSRQLVSQALGQRVSFVIPGVGGTAIGAVSKGLVKVCDHQPVGPPTIVVESDLDDTFVNDGKTGPDGLLYFGTFDRRRRPGICGLYRLGVDGNAVRIASGLTISNGIDWSPDGTNMYAVDSDAQHVLAFDFDPIDGVVSGRREFVAIPAAQGMPDGLCVDADGDVWVALYGGGAIHRYTASGVLRATIDVPVDYPTSCCFAGPDLDVLAVTTGFARILDGGRDPGILDGALLVAEVNAQGQPARECEVVPAQVVDHLGPV